MSPAKRRKSWPLLVLVLAAAAWAGAQIAAVLPERLSAIEFTRLVNDLSEEGGYFFSDNFTSNEDSYLTVVETMQQLGTAGGAYVGVGPEQNFTYIAKTHPRIAFIVDIRRQAMIQHLMYKAIFWPTPMIMISCEACIAEISSSLWSAILAGAKLWLRSVII